MSHRTCGLNAGHTRCMRRCPQPVGAAGRRCGAVKSEQLRKVLDATPAPRPFGAAICPWPEADSSRRWVRTGAEQSCRLSSAPQAHRRGAKRQGPFVADPCPPFAGLACLSRRGGKAASTAQSCPLGGFGRCLCLATAPKAPKAGAGPSPGWVRFWPWANSSPKRPWSRHMGPLSNRVVDYDTATDWLIDFGNF